MRRITFSIMLFAGFSGVLPAQKDLTIDEIFRKPELNPITLKQLKWAGSDNRVSWVAKEKLVIEVIEKVGTSAQAFTPDTVLTLAELNKELKRFPQITWLDEERFTYSFKGNQIIYNLKNKQEVSRLAIGEDAELTDFTEKFDKVAFTKKNNLFVQMGSTVRNISNEQNEDVVYGQSVHRNEFGISKGTFWSPMGGKLAFYRMDQSMVTDYPIVNIGTKPAEVNAIKYPMAGQKSHHVTVGVYDWNTEKTVYLQTGEPREQYLTNISWTPDEQFILIAVVNRDQNEMKLNQYRVSDGSFVKTLFVESDPQWVEPENPAVFIPGKLDQFIWQSERNGFNQLYHYNLEGKLIQSLCPEKMIVTDFNGFDQSGKELFVTVSENDGLQRAAWRITLKGKANKIQMANGVHRIQLNRSGNMMLDEFSSAEIPKISAFTPYSALVQRIDGKIAAVLQNSDDPTLGYNLPKPSIVQLKASDGTVLNGRLYMPKNMDPNKKYPVVIYLYGGPHAQMVTNSWMAGGNLWMSWMASQGYIVWTMDNRGSADRGLEFEQVVHGRLGTIEMEDQLKGVEYLKSLPQVDPSRIGVHGWSFGGFMTTTLLAKNPGVFKAGVAGGPVIDWSLYEIMYTERYMDTPEQNPKGYEESNLLNSAKKLKDRLMLIHGTVDDVVVWQHSQEMVKKCVEEGVLIDYMIYPEHPHNVVGKDRLHLYKTISRYLMDNL